MRKIEGIFTWFIRFIFKFRATTYDIAFVEVSYPSGSNTRILYDYFKENYEYKLLYLERSRPLNFSERIKEYISFNYKLSTAKILVGTHGITKLKKSQVVINLWHGIPLKSMNNMEELLTNPVKFQDEYLITSSMFESILLTACMFIPYERHRHFGNPRLDYLLSNRINVPLIDEINKYKHSIIYMPTFRDQAANRRDGEFYGNLFNMELFDTARFNEYLVKHDILLITKYHPFEAGNLNEPLNDFSNIMILNNDDLIDNNIDLYELLPQTDLLITDYSSVYFDYLLLDKPIIFTPTDLEQYSETRGLLLQPYDNWTPGTKALSQDDIEIAIIRELNNDTFREVRMKLKDTAFMKDNTNGNNTKKTAVFISNILSNSDS